jgi:hypothetical protein
MPPDKGGFLTIMRGKTGNPRTVRRLAETGFAGEPVYTAAAWA